MKTRRMTGMMWLTGAALAAAVGCSNSPAGPAYAPLIPTIWASAVTHPLFPLVVGTTTQFSQQTSAGLETITVEVLPGTRMVNGVAATIVRDRVYLNGSLIEDTYDWYAQDGAGNVWYLGEDSKEIVNGQVVNSEGSWEWAVDGALPGIYMWADVAAQLGVAYRQEFYRGVAEDWGKVVTLNQTVTVPFGTFTGCLTTEDWVGLAPEDPHALKTYCPGVGQVRDSVIGSSEPPLVLISRTP